MFNIFASLIGSALSSTQKKLMTLPVAAEKAIQELAQEERSAVAGGPQVENEPEG
jgi:hypothetical protein